MNILSKLKSRNKNFWILEIFSSLQYLAMSIPSIFIPIFLLSIGFQLEDIILYYAILHFFDFILNFLSKKSLENFGSKFSYIVSTISVILFYLSYLFMDDKNWFNLILMAFFIAVSDSFYYVAFYYGIIDNSKIENSKSNNIIINILSTIATTIGPLLGAAIVFLTEDKNHLLLVAIAILFISLIPLFYYRPKHQIKKTPLRFSEFFKDRRNRKNFLSLGFYKITEIAEYILFPVFIYLAYKSLDSVALVSVIAVFSTLFFTYLSGNIEKEKREKVVILGALSLIFIWLGRIFIDNEFYLYLSVALSGVFALFVRMPVETNIFKHGKEVNQLLTAFYKNTVSMGFKMLFFILIYILIKFLDLKSIFWLMPAFLALIIVTNLLYLKRKNSI